MITHNTKFYPGVEMQASRRKQFSLPKKQIDQLRKARTNGDRHRVEQLLNQGVDPLAYYGENRVAEDLMMTLVNSTIDLETLQVVDDLIFKAIFTQPDSIEQRLLADDYTNIKIENIALLVKLGLLPTVNKHYNLFHHILAANSDIDKRLFALSNDTP